MSHPTPNNMPGAQNPAGGAPATDQQPTAATPPEGAAPQQQQAAAGAEPERRQAPWEQSGEPFDPGRAWSTILQQRTENAALKEQLQQAQPVLDEHERLRQASQSDLDRTRENLTTTEASRDTWRSEAVQAKAEALAAGRFADVSVAVKLLGDLSGFATDTGIDTAKLTASLDGLATDHPFLLLQPGSHGLQPDRAQGQSAAGGGSAPTIDDQIKAAEARGDITSVIALKQQKFFSKK